MEDQFYFKQCGEYRYSSAKEVEEKFYCNVSYMKQYMIGLALSTYLLDSHRKCMRWYKEKLEEYKEGGTWHGEYFIAALQNTNYNKYLGVDISETCVEMCKAIVKHTCCNLEKKNICLE